MHNFKERVRISFINYKKNEKVEVCNFGGFEDDSFSEDDIHHSFTVFGKRAKVLQEYVKKGHELLVEGKLRYRTFTNKDGIEEKEAFILVSDFKFCTSKAEAERIIEKNENNS